MLLCWHNPGALAYAWAASLVARLGGRRAHDGITALLCLLQSEKPADIDFNVHWARELFALERDSVVDTHGTLLPSTDSANT